MSMRPRQNKMASNQIQPIDQIEKIWSEEVTKILIGYGRRNHKIFQFSLENCKTSKETGQVYRTLLVSILFKRDSKRFNLF